MRDAGDGRGVFVNYLLPVVTNEPPVPAPFCDEIDCIGAGKSQWQRVQEAAQQANDPCEFTALIGYEWTASPNGRHWHRNVIFRSDQVPDQAFDYIRYPSVDRLWSALAEHCRPEDGCDAVAIPHNLNWTDGGTFDVENDSPDVAALRARYERLAEMHQEKGASECLPETRGRRHERLRLRAGGREQRQAADDGAGDRPGRRVARHALGLLPFAAEQRTGGLRKLGSKAQPAAAWRHRLHGRALRRRRVHRRIHLHRRRVRHLGGPGCTARQSDLQPGRSGGGLGHREHPGRRVRRA